MSTVLFIFRALPILLSASFLATAAYATFIHRKFGPRPTHPDTPWHRNFTVLVRLVVLQVVLAICSLETGQYVARAAFRAQVRELTQSEYLVRVNGRPLSDEEKLRVVGASSSVKWIMANHSYAQEKLQIQIESPGDTLSFAVGRDSRRPDVWWIFYPTYSETHEIGRVRTTAFDQLILDEQ